MDPLTGWDRRINSPLLRLVDIKNIKPAEKAINDGCITVDHWIEDLHNQVAACAWDNHFTQLVRLGRVVALTEGCRTDMDNTSTEEIDRIPPGLLAVVPDPGVSDVLPIGDVSCLKAQY